MHIKDVHISGAKVGIKTEGPITGKFENVKFTNVEKPYDISGASKIEMSGTRIENSQDKKSAGSTRYRAGYTGRNGPPLPAFCPRCKSIFPSKHYDIGSSQFFGFDNEEICQNPECGYEHAKVAEGLFNLAKEVVEVLQAEPLTSDMLAAISSAAKDFLEERADDVTTIAKIQTQNPKLASIFGKFLQKGANFAAVAALWFAIFPTQLLTLQSYFSSSEPAYRRTHEIERVCLESFGEVSTQTFILPSGGGDGIDAPDSFDEMKYSEFMYVPEPILGKPSMAASLSLFEANEWNSCIDSAHGHIFSGWISPPSGKFEDAIVEVFANDEKVDEVIATRERPDVEAQLSRIGFQFDVDLELPQIANKLKDGDKVQLRYPGGGKLNGPNLIIVRKSVEPMTSISRYEIDAKLDASSVRMEATEARMDAKLSQIGGDFNRVASDIAQTITALRADMAQTTTALRSDIAVVNARLETVPRVGGMIITAISAVVSVVGVILAVLAFGGDRFDGGVQITSASVEAAIDAKNTADETAKKVEELRRSVEALTKAVNHSTSMATEPPRSPPN